MSRESQTNFMIPYGCAKSEIVIADLSIDVLVQTNAHSKDYCVDGTFVSLIHTPKRIEISQTLVNQ